MPRELHVVRDGDTTSNIPPFQVKVLELLPDGSQIDVEGKWLYVFSGDGVDFGEAVCKQEPPNTFSLDFPGRCLAVNPPDRVEYEVMITPEDPPDPELVKAITGEDSFRTDQYEFGAKWYFLTDPDILGKATSGARSTRNMHTRLKSNMIELDLTRGRRYYFLLSPVQLGPSAISFAMKNPEALTPLYVPEGLAKMCGAPDAASGPEPEWMAEPASDVHVGPLFDSYPEYPIIFLLPVIDPYAWAESLARDKVATALKEYGE